MMFLQVTKFVVLYSFIKLFVMCDFTNSDDDAAANGRSDNAEDDNLVLDSVYDTMKHNYEVKMRQNLDRLNFISEIRSKRNINEPMSMTPMNMNTVDFYKNHQNQYEVNRKEPVNFPLGFKSPPRLVPILAQPNPIQQRSDYEYEEYHKCQEKPTVQTFHISDHEKESQHQLPGISTVLLTGLKYLFGGFAILALPFIVLKALFLPLKFFLFLKAFAIIKTFLFLTIFLRFLRFNRRIGALTGTNNNNNFLGIPGAKNKHKLQTIKDILNSEDFADEEDIDYKTDDEDVMSKESVGAPMYIDNPFNNTEVSEEFVQNLAKLIRLKNKKW